MKPVFVIMVTYRRFEHFERTVESLLPTLPRGSEIAVVYNSEGKHESDAKYMEFFSGIFDVAADQYGVQFNVLDTGTNEGWGSAVNEGLHVYSQWKNFEYVLESNNDIEYKLGWCGKAQSMMYSHSDIGIFGLFKHPYHGTREVLPDGLVIKDDMPATAWFFRSKDLIEFLPFPEHGACKTRGGNGEDVAFRDKVQNKFGRWICGTTEDFAQHIDGYDIPDLGKPNSAYA